MSIDRTQRLREGSIPGLLAAFSIPAIVGLLAQASYSVVDRIFIGHALGSDAIAGIAVCFPFMLIILAFGMLIGFGATALISIRLGEQKKPEAELVLGNAVVLLVVSSVLLSVVGLLLLDRLLVLFGATEIILPYAHDYMLIIVLGTFFQIVGYGLNNPIRGEGNPRIAMLTMLIGVVLNVILAPIFIFVFGWGMYGVALATVLSQAVSAIWVVGYYLSGKSLLKIRWDTLRLDKTVCLGILAVGSPPFILQLAASAMQATLFNQLGFYGGEVAISVMGVLFVVSMMFFMPIFGINQGSQPIMGYNYGARQFDRVRKALKTAILAASVIAVAGFLTMMLAPAQVIWLFNSKDEALLQMGVNGFRISSIMMPTIGFQIVSAGYFQAVGKPREAMLVSVSRQVLFLIPALLILPHFFGLNGVWAALPAADCCSALMTGILLYLELGRLKITT
jgi:putative MATE family efflux protein